MTDSYFGWYMNKDYPEFQGFSLSEEEFEVSEKRLVRVVSQDFKKVLRNLPKSARCIEKSFDTKAKKASIRYIDADRMCHDYYFGGNDYQSGHAGFIFEWSW